MINYVNIIIIIEILILKLMEVHVPDNGRSSTFSLSSGVLTELPNRNTCTSNSIANCTLHKNVLSVKNEVIIVRG